METVDSHNTLEQDVRESCAPSLLAYSHTLADPEGARKRWVLPRCPQDPLLNLWLFRRPSADFETLEALLHHLGLSNMRARRLIVLSKMYMEYPPNPRLVYKSKVVKDKRTIEYPPTHVSHYPGSGKYALDSYRIFCMGRGEWKKVFSDDKELRRYLVSPYNHGGLCVILTYVLAVEMGS
jgi:hypothetical protein